jgi:hypothetical protein
VDAAHDVFVRVLRNERRLHSENPTSLINVAGHQDGYALGLLSFAPEIEVHPQIWADELLVANAAAWMGRRTWCSPSPRRGTPGARRGPAASWACASEGAAGGCGPRRPGEWCYAGAVVGVPDIDNVTPFAFEPVFTLDEHGRQVLVPVVKATFDIGDAGLTPAPAQRPVALAGEPYGDPETSSYRWEPEAALPKPATDVVLLGSAVAPAGKATEAMVAVAMGPLRKVVRVVGDRVFFRSMGSIGISSPAPFEQLPLQWERAFGGWDRSDPDAAKHECDPRNPVGRGFRRKGGRFEEGVLCPNLEDPGQPLRGWGDRPAPVGFGFTSSSWAPRPSLGGTYDEGWRKTRAPLLPADFSRRFLSAAAPGLIAPGHLRGDEKAAVSGATRGRPLAFRLPGSPPPEVLVVRDGMSDRRVQTALDSVVIDADARQVILIWKGELALRREPLEVAALQVTGGGAAPGKGVEP